ncbi:MAG: N-acetylneuraminate synthase [Bacteroidota bacterium]
MKNTVIIAEAGVNHNGSMDLAKQLIDVAAEAGADYVKFQTFKSELVISKNAKKADYQIANTEDEVESQLEMVKKYELDKPKHIELINYSRERGIKFLSSPFDLPSIDLLLELGIEIFKIPSGEITNLPYLRKVAPLAKEIILSTGMCNLADIETAIDILLKNGASLNNITVLHCNTEYPTPFKDVNLKAMNTIGNAFKVKIGYSDHTLGIEIPVAAVALGACIIEKHFTLDKNLKGPDHIASLDPAELKEMIKAIRNIDLALGNGIKQPSESEQKNINIARKSIVAATDLKEGDVLRADNIYVKRPGSGISPLAWDSIIGKTVLRSFSADELLDMTYLK